MIAAIVLAAGQSLRMGRNKLLLPYGSATIIEYVVAQLAASDVDEVYVVVGHEAPRITEILCDTPTRVVHNPDYELGMFSSVRCGVAAVPSTCAAYVIALGDQPAIRTADVNALVTCFRDSAEGIIVPEFEGRRGHPVVISARYTDEILAKWDQAGLRGLLHAHAADVRATPIDWPGVTQDMDTPEDYARALDTPRA